MIKIKKASVSDISLIREIAEQSWWPTYSPILNPEQIRYMLDSIYSAEALLKVMQNGSQKFLVLYDDNGAQGFAAYGLKSEEPTVCKLHKIYVLPDNHGKGYGKMLIEEVKKILRDQKIKFLDLNVNRMNSARFFYEKCGFTIIREEDIPIGPYWMNDYVMRIDIS